MKRKRSLPLAAKVTAWRGEYAGPPSIRQSEYRLLIELTNKTEREFLFSGARLVISPPSGGALRIAIAHGSEGSANQPLPPGETWRHVVTTNGYTSNLLIDAQGHPLRVTLSIERKGVRFGAPFIGLLPELDLLPPAITDPLVPDLGGIPGFDEIPGFETPPAGLPVTVSQVGSN